MTHDPTKCPTPEQLLELYPVFCKSPYTVGLERWDYNINSIGAGDYITQIVGVKYIYQSDGSEAGTSELRDGILGVLSQVPTTQWVVEGTAIDHIDIRSNVDGLALDVAIAGPPGFDYILTQLTFLSPSHLIEQALDFASCLVCDWGCSTFNGCMAAAVHWLKMWTQGQSINPGPTGQIASMTQGPFSVSFAQQQLSNGSDGWWTSTPEGSQFLFLRKQQGPKPVRVRGGMSCYPGRIFGGRRGGCRRW